MSYGHIPPAPQEPKPPNPWLVAFFVLLVVVFMFFETVHFA